MPAFVAILCAIGASILALWCLVVLACRAMAKQPPPSRTPSPEAIDRWFDQEPLPDHGREKINP